MKLLIIICIFSSFLSFGSKKQNFNVDRYLKLDFLSGEAQKKRDFQQKAAQKIYENKKSQYYYPSYNDFWQFASEYWLVKNVTFLKWDKGADATSLKRHFQKLLESIGEERVTFQIFISPTSWVPHAVLPRGIGHYVFIISQQFIMDAKFNQEQLAFVLLEDFFRFKQGYLFDFLKKEDFYQKLGQSFYNQKKPNMINFEILMKKLTFFIRQYGHSFKQEFQVVKSLVNKLKDHKKIRDNYKSYLSKLSSKEAQLEKTFPRLNGLYPTAQLKLKWLQMLVR